MSKPTIPWAALLVVAAPPLAGQSTPDAVRALQDYAAQGDFVRITLSDEIEVRGYYRGSQDDKILIIPSGAEPFLLDAPDVRSITVRERLGPRGLIYGAVIGGLGTSTLLWLSRQLSCSDIPERCDEEQRWPGFTIPSVLAMMVGSATAPWMPRWIEIYP